MTFSLPGLAPSRAALLDERSRPDFRTVFGALARRARRIDSAVRRVRIATLDLGPQELEHIERFRVLIAELNALTLDAEAQLIQSDPRRAPRVPLFRELLESERLQVRSAPLGGWSPDFSVFSDDSGPMAVVAGVHRFDRPYPHRGPALASLHFDDAARLASARHEELWEQGHDVGPAVWSILSKAERAGRALRGAAKAG